MMIKVGTITFHGAHNYGSVLQAFALQEFVKDVCRVHKRGCDYSVINFRSDVQKKVYGQKKDKIDVKTVLKSVMRVPYRRKLQKRSELFESFINEKLNLTKEYNSESSLYDLANSFDCFISGSDQLWNIRAADFSFANLLDFTDKKKISYAASLGPLEIDWSKYPKREYVEKLSRFDAISVREQRSKEIVDELLGRDIAQIHVDPTLLLEADLWRKIQAPRKIDGDYIFLYCLEPTKRQLLLAKTISDRLGMRIVVSGWRNRRDYFNSFVKAYDIGPLDFLSLIDSAKLVLTSSFHGTAFSLVYRKPFYVLDAGFDARIISLLQKCNLTDRLIKSVEEAKNVALKELNEGLLHNFFTEERKRSELYLAKELELDSSSSVRGE